MLKNHLKVAFRSIIKQKGLAFINVFGLSTGLACFCLFLIYAVHEFSFDQFHEKGDRIYRMYRYSEAFGGQGPQSDAHLPMPMGPAVSDAFPDVERVVRWKQAWGENFVRIGGQISKAEITHTESSVFEVFTFPLKYGDPASALGDPRNVVLTEQTALRLFGESNPIGKTLEIKIEDEFEAFTVSAVAENIPTYSSKRFDILGSMDYYASTAHGQSSKDNWRRSFLGVFVLLQEGSGLADNASALLDFRQRHYPEVESSLRESGRWTGEGAPITYRLQPVADMHTVPYIRGNEVPPIDPKNIWMLLTIAGGVLLIAIINFTTLAIGRSAGRAKEVGVRKVIGSTRGTLVTQFMTEAMLMSMISVLVGLAFVQFLLPYFNELADRDLVFSVAQFPELVWMIPTVTLLAGLLAGSYPALMLSGFQPIEVLKNKIRLGGANVFTKSLVTTQFALSSALVIATLVIIHQLNYMRSKNPGFQKENVVLVDGSGTDREKVFPLFKEALLRDPQIVNVGAAELGMGEGFGWSRAGFDYQGELKQVYEYYVDDDYKEVLGLELIEGRWFEPDRQDGPNRGVVVNETMVREFGWTNETAVGQVLGEYFNGENEIQPHVIGVIRDINFRPLSEEVSPQLFHQFEDYSPFILWVRIRPGDPSRTLRMMEDSWSAIVPGFPLKYNFLDDGLDQFYQSEARFSRIIGWAGGISIFLACLGLLGLAALSAVNRTKEIGIRKVLGASVRGIILLLSKDFLKLVAIALMIASPIAWYLMNSWLDNFAYRIQMEWWMFVLSGAIALGIAFLTVGLQSFRAAMANPVSSLRNE